MIKLNYETDVQWVHGWKNYIITLLDSNSVTLFASNTLLVSDVTILG
jgi:hypothetical protein